MLHQAVQSHLLVCFKARQAGASDARLGPRTDSAPARLTWEIPKGECP